MASAPDDVVAVVVQKVLTCLGNWDAGVDGARSSLSQLLQDTATRKPSGKARSKKGTDNIAAPWLTDPNRVSTAILLASLVASRWCTSDFASISLALITTVLGDNEVSLEQPLETKSLGRSERALHVLVASLPYLDKTSLVTAKDAIDALRRQAVHTSPSSSSSWIGTAGYLSALVASYLCSTPERQYRLMTGVQETFQLMLNRQQAVANTHDIPALLVLLAAGFHESNATSSSSNTLMSVCRSLCMYSVTWSGQGSGAAGHASGNTHPGVTCVSQGTSRKADTNIRCTFVGCLTSEQRWWLACVTVHSMQSIIVSRVAMHRAAGKQAQPARSVPIGAGKLPTWLPYACSMLNDLLQYEHELGPGPDGSVVSLALCGGIEGLLAEAAIEELTAQSDTMYGGTPPTVPYSASSSSSMTYMYWSSLSSSPSSASSDGVFGPRPLTQWTTQQCMQNVGWPMRLAILLSTFAPAAARSPVVHANATYVPGHMLCPTVQPWKVQAPAPAPGVAVAGMLAAPPTAAKAASKAKGKTSSKSQAGATSSLPLSSSIPAPPPAGAIAYKPSKEHIDTLTTAALMALGADMQTLPVAAAAEVSAPPVPPGRVKNTARKGAAAPEVGSTAATSAARKGRKAAPAPAAVSAEQSSAASTTLDISMTPEKSAEALSALLSLRSEIVLPPPPAIVPVYKNAAVGALALARVLREAITSAAQTLALSCVSAKIAPLKPESSTSSTSTGGGVGAHPSSGAGTSAKEAAEAMAMYNDAMWQLQNSSIPLLRLPEPVGPSDVLVRRAKLCLHVLETVIVPSSVQAAEVAALNITTQRTEIVQGLLDLAVSVDSFAQMASTFARIAHCFVFYAPTVVDLPPDALDKAKKLQPEPFRKVFQDSSFSTSFNGSASAAKYAGNAAATIGVAGARVGDVHGFLPPSLDAASTHGRCAYGRDNLLSASIELMADATNSSRYDANGDYSYGSYYGSGTPGALCEASLPSLASAWQIHCLLTGVQTVLTSVPGLVEGSLEYDQCDPGALFGWAHAMSSATTGTSSSSSSYSSKSNAAFMAMTSTLLHSASGAELPASAVGREYPWLSVPSPHAWLQQSSSLTQRITVPSSTAASSSDPYSSRGTSTTSSRTAQGPEAAQAKWPTSFHALHMRRRAVQACLHLSCSILAQAARTTFGAHLLATRLGPEGTTNVNHISGVSYQLERWGVFAVLRALSPSPAETGGDAVVAVGTPRRDSDVIIIDDAGKSAGREPSPAVPVHAASHVAAGSSAADTRAKASDVVDLDVDTDEEMDGRAAVAVARAESVQTSARDANERASSYDASQELHDPEVDDEEDDGEDEDHDDYDDDDGGSDNDDEAYRFSDGESDVDAAETDLSSMVRMEIAALWPAVLQPLIGQGRVDYGQSGNSHCVKLAGPAESDVDDLVDDVLADIADSRPQDFLRKHASKQVKLLKRSVMRCIRSYVLACYPPPPSTAQSSSTSAPFSSSISAASLAQKLVSSAAGAGLAASVNSAPAFSPVGASEGSHPYQSDDLAVDVHVMATETLSALGVAGFQASAQRPCHGNSPACAAGSCMCCVPRQQTLSGSVETLLRAAEHPDILENLQRGFEVFLDRNFTCNPSRTTTVYEFATQKVSIRKVAAGQTPKAPTVEPVSIPKALSIVFGLLRKQPVDIFDTSCPALDSIGRYIDGKCFYAPTARTNVAQSVQPPRKDVKAENIISLLSTLRLTSLAHACLSKAAMSAPLSLTLRTVVSGAAVPRYNADVRSSSASSAGAGAGGGPGAPSMSHRYSLHHGMKATDNDILLGPHSNAGAAYACKDPSSLHVPFLFTSQNEPNGVIVTGPGGYNELSASVMLNLHVVGVDGTQGTLSAASNHAGQKRARAEIEADEIEELVDDEVEEHRQPSRPVKMAKFLSDAAPQVPSSLSALLHAASSSSAVPSPGPLDSCFLASLQSAPAVSMNIVEELILRKLPQDTISFLLRQQGSFFTTWATSIIGRTIALHPRHVHSVPPVTKEPSGSGSGAGDTGAGSASAEEAAQTASNAPATVSFGGYTGLTKAPDSGQLSDAYERALSTLEKAFTSGKVSASGTRVTSQEYTEQHAALSEEYSRLMSELRSATSHRAGAADSGARDGEEGEDTEDDYDPRAQAEAMALGLTMSQYRARYARGGKKPSVGVKTLYADMFAPAKGVRPTETKVGDVPVPWLATVTGFDAERGAHTVVYISTKGAEDVILPLCKYTLLAKDVTLDSAPDTSAGVGAGSSATGVSAQREPTGPGKAPASASAEAFTGFSEGDMVDVDEDEASLDGGEVEVQASSATSAAALSAGGAGGPSTASASGGAAPATTSAGTSSSAPLPTEWNCALCTFANSWGLSVCSMCGTGQPAEVKQRKAAASGSGAAAAGGGTITSAASAGAEPEGGPSATDYEWSCTRCTYRQPVTKVLGEDERYGGPTGQPLFERTVKLVGSNNTVLYIGLNRRCCMCNMSVPTSTLKSAMTKSTGSTSTAESTIEKLGMSSGVPAGPGGGAPGSRPARVISDDNRKAAKEIFLAEINNAVSSKSLRHLPRAYSMFGGPSGGRFAPPEDTGTDEDDGLGAGPSGFLARIGSRVALAARSTHASSLPSRIRPLYLLNASGTCEDVRAAWTGLLPDSKAGMKQNRVTATMATCMELDALSWSGSTHKTTLYSSQRFGSFTSATLTDRRVFSASPVLETIRLGARVGVGHRVDAMSMQGKWMEATVVGFGVESSKLSDSSYPITHALVNFTGTSTPMWYPLSAASARQASAAGSSTSSSVLPELAPLGTYTRDWREEVLTKSSEIAQLNAGQSIVSASTSTTGKTPKVYVEVRHNGVWHVAEVHSVKKGRNYFPEAYWTSASAGVTTLSALRRGLAINSRSTPLRADTAVQFPEARLVVRFYVKPRPGSSLRPGHGGMDPSTGMYIYTESIALCGEKVAPLGTHIRYGTSAASSAYCPGFSQSEHLPGASGWESGNYYTGKRYDTAFPHTESRPVPVPGAPAQAQAQAQGNNSAAASSLSNVTMQAASTSSSAAVLPVKVALLELSKVPLHLRASVHEDACLASFLWNEEGSRSREFSLAQLVERVVGVDQSKQGKAVCAPQVLRMYGSTEEQVPTLKLRFRLWGRRDCIRSVAEGSPGGATGSYEELICASLDSQWTGAASGSSIFSTLVDLAARLAVQAGAPSARIQDWALAIARQVLRSPITGLKHGTVKAVDYSRESMLSQVSSTILDYKGVHLQVQPVLVMAGTGTGPVGGQQHVPYPTQPVEERVVAKETALTAVLGELALDSTDMLCSLHALLQEQGHAEGDMAGAAAKLALQPLYPSDAARNGWPLILQSMFTNKTLLTLAAVQAADTASTSTGRVPLWWTLLCQRLAHHLLGGGSSGQGSGLAVTRVSPSNSLTAIIPASTRAALMNASSFGFIRGMVAGQATSEAYTAIRNLGKVGQRYATYDGMGRPVTQEYKLEPGTVVDMNRVELARVAYKRRTLNPADSSPSHTYGRSSTTGYTGVGVLQKDRVSVSRQNLLEDAHCALKLHALGESARAKLDLMFQDEKAYGSGVSQEFYACVAADLQKTGLQLSASNSSSAESIPSAVVDGASLFYSTASSESAFVTHPEGLFPRPEPQDSQAQKVYGDRYELIGLAFGKALQDGFVFPIPLALPFVQGVQALLRGQRWCGLPALCEPNAVDASAARKTIGSILRDSHVEDLLRAYSPSMLNLLELARKRHILRLSESQGPGAGTTQADLVLDGGARVEDLCLSWIDPGSSCNLVRHLQRLGSQQVASTLSTADLYDASPIQHQARFMLRVLQLVLGSQRVQALADDNDGGDVTTEEVDVYVALHVLYLLRLGVWSAYQSFVRGLALTVTPLHHLLMLTPSELQGLVCGAKTVDWTLDSLKQHVQAGGGYGIDSKPVHMLMEVLVGMSQEERGEFLRFVTGCPTLPPGGLAALTPALKVMQKLDIPPPPAWMREGASGPPGSAGLGSAAVGGGFPPGSSTQAGQAGVQGSSTGSVATLEDGPDTITMASPGRRAACTGAASGRKAAKKSAGQTASGGTGEQAGGSGEADGEVVDLIGSARSGTKRGRAGTPARDAAGKAVGALPTSASRTAPLSAQEFAQLMTSPHDRALVSASTCFHQVRLPPYSSVRVMRHQLLEAMRASAGLIDFS